MRQVLLSLVVIGLLIGVAAAQYPYGGPHHAEQPPMVPVPEMGSSAPTALIPPAENFRHGWRQTWTHEFRPFREHGVAPQPTHQWYPTHGYHTPQYPTQGHQQGGWWFNPRTGHWQRTVSPATCRPTYHHVRPW